MNKSNEVNKGLELLLSNEFPFFPDKNIGGVDPNHLFNNFCFLLLGDDSNHSILTKRIVTNSKQRKYKVLKYDDKVFDFNTLLSSIYNSDKTIFSATSSPLVLLSSVSGHDMNDKNIASKVLKLLSCNELLYLKKYLNFVLFDSYVYSNSNDAVSILNKKLFVDGQSTETVDLRCSHINNCPAGTIIGTKFFNLLVKLFDNSVKSDLNGNPTELIKSRYYIITNLIYVLSFYSGLFLLNQIENSSKDTDATGHKILPYFVYGGVPPGDVNSPFSRLSRETLVFNTKITYSAMHSFVTKAVSDENIIYEKDYDKVLNRLLNYMAGSMTKSLALEICDYAKIDDFLDSFFPESRLFNSFVSMTKKVGFSIGENTKARLVLENSAVSCLVACLYSENLSFDCFIDLVFENTGLLLGTLSNNAKNEEIVDRLNSVIQGIDINKILRENKEKLRMRMVELSLCIEYSDGISVIKNG